VGIGRGKFDRFVFGQWRANPRNYWSKHASRVGLGFQLILNIAGVYILRAHTDSPFVKDAVTAYINGVKNFEGWSSLAECLFAPTVLDPLLDLLGLKACAARVASRAAGAAEATLKAAEERAGQVAHQVAKAEGSRTVAALTYRLLRQGPFASSREDSELKYTTRDFVKSYVAIYIGTYTYACLTFREHICKSAESIRDIDAKLNEEAWSGAAGDIRKCLGIGQSGTSLMATLWDFANMDTAQEFGAFVAVNLVCALAICTVLILAWRFDAASKTKPQPLDRSNLSAAHSRPSFWAESARLRAFFSTLLAATCCMLYALYFFAFDATTWTRGGDILFRNILSGFEISATTMTFGSSFTRASRVDESDPLFASASTNASESGDLKVKYEAVGTLLAAFSLAICACVLACIALRFLHIMDRKRVSPAVPIALNIVGLICSSIAFVYFADTTFKGRIAVAGQNDVFHITGALRPQMDWGPAFNVVAVISFSLSVVTMGLHYRRLDVEASLASLEHRSVAPPETPPGGMPIVKHMANKV